MDNWNVEMRDIPSTDPLHSSSHIILKSQVMMRNFPLLFPESPSTAMSCLDTKREE